MMLDLDTTEANDLREAVQSFSKVLLNELARADDREYRQMLREKVRRYEALLARLEPVLAAEQPL